MGPVRVISGIAVAPGLAMGPAHVVRAAPNVVPTWTVPEVEVEAEVERLIRALEAVGDRLEERRQMVAQQAGEQDAEIFSVHRMILQDPVALKRAIARIREERVNAEASVQALIDHLVETLGGLEGDSVRSYGADVSDPWRAVLEELMDCEREEFVSRGERVVLAAAELTPQVVTLLERDRVLAVVAETGGRFSHGAVLARSLGFPCVVGIPNLLSRLEQGLVLIVDGDRGQIQLRPAKEDIDSFLDRHEQRQAWLHELTAHADLPAVTPDGHSINVRANVESLRDLDTFDIRHTDGIGLLRTEFLYMERTQFPSEEEQYRLYRRAVERAAGRLVTLRTLDIGGDKPLPYFRTPHETNPALGWRGLRVSLEWQDLLRVQLRAALRASAHGPLRLLLPMVTSLEEVLRVHEIFLSVRKALEDHGYETAAEVPTGVMVEVPSSLLTIEHLLEEVDFVSVGTNDLTQYLLAADRDNPWVARLYDPCHPAVVWALHHVAEVAGRMGKECSVCGEMAGDYATALLFLGLGYTSLSMAPNFVPEVKHAIRQIPHADCVELAREVLQQRSSAGVEGLLQALRTRLHDPEASVESSAGDGADPGGGQK